MHTSFTVLLARVPRAQTPRDTETAHSWTWTGTHWQCDCCFRTCRNPKRVRDTCNRLPLLFLQTIQHNNGHHLWMACYRGRPPPDGLFVYCARCAKHGSHHSVKGLRHLCAGRPYNITYERFARNFAQGIHPSGAQFNRPWPLGCFSHATAAVAHVPVQPAVPHSNSAQRGTLDDDDWQGIPEIGECLSD